MGKLAATGTAFACFFLVTITADAAFPGKAGSLVFSGAGGEIISVRPDGSSLRQLTFRQEDDMQPTFSPDGERLAFVRGAANTVGKVVIARRDGSGQRRIFTGTIDVAWSPDGASLAVIDQFRKIVLISASGHRFRRLSRPQLEVTSVSWSPDGKRLAFGVFLREGAGALYVVGVGGRGLRAIVKEPAGTNLHGPQWSPDGRRIAFQESEGCRGDTCGGPFFVSVIDADGSDKQRLMSGVGAAWSPDGSRLAFDRVDGSGIATLRLDDGTIRAVTSARSHGDIDWQPLCTRRGGRGRDLLRGRGGGDVVCGLSGNDVITGGRGSDRLFGEEGNDHFFARDGEFDVIGCGTGHDSVEADRRDLVGRDCERVRRGSR